MTWHAAMVDGLLEERERGEVEFAKAWRRAERRALDLGEHKPRELVTPPDEGADWLPFAAFFRRACHAEWDGLVRADYAQMPAMTRREAEPAPLGAERVVLLA